MPKKKNPWWVWLLPLPVVWWAALLAAGSWVPSASLLEQIPYFTAAMDDPFSLRWTEYSMRFLFLFSPDLCCCGCRSLFPAGKTSGAARNTDPPDGAMCSGL